MTRPDDDFEPREPAGRSPDAESRAVRLLRSGVAEWNANRPARPDLRRADLRGLDLRGADLRNTDLRWSDLRECDLRGAQLDGADLRDADLRNTRMDKHALRGARFEGARIDGVGTTLEAPSESPPPEPETSPATNTDVELGVAAPTRARLRIPFTARLAAYPSGDHDQVKPLLEGVRADAKLGAASCRWPLGTEVSVSLAGDGIQIVGTPQRFTWEGRAEVVEFLVRPMVADTDVVLCFSVEAAGIPVALVPIKVTIESVAPRWQRAAHQIGLLAPPPAGDRSITRHKVATSAFASYASEDRARVADAVTALSAVGVDVFLDCLSLRPGEEFKPALRKELLDRDLFVLFWSTHAKESPWVTWERQTVLSERGDDSICISPLEVGVTPPPELSHLNFSSASAIIGSFVRLRAAAAE